MHLIPLALGLEMANGWVIWGCGPKMGHFKRVESGSGQSGYGSGQVGPYFHLLKKKLMTNFERE